MTEGFGKTPESSRGERAAGETEGHRAGHRHDIVLTLVADEHVRGPRLELVIADEPVDHFGGGDAERTVEGGDELGLAANGDDVVGGLDAGVVDAGALAEGDGKGHVHGGLDAGAGGLAVGL